jgi:nucleoside-diphosphate-sugar epimerase
VDSDSRLTSSFVNICDYDQLQPEFADADVVVHLVGLVSSSIKDKENLFAVNVNGTENVLRAMLHHNVHRLIHVSSVAALGFPKNSSDPIDENYAFDWSIARRQKKYYMLTKHLADVKVLEYREKGIDSTILHPSLLYGPGDVANSSRLIRAIRSGKIPFNMPGGMSAIHVQDVADGIIAALESNIRNEQILLSGENHTFKEINSIIAQELDVVPPKKTMPRFLHPVLFQIFQMLENLSRTKPQLSADDVDNAFRFRYFDNTKAFKLLGWKPRITFQDTIRETITWMRQHDLLDE